jgi:hypothetical protein
LGPARPGKGETDARKASTGLWVVASYINHSCVSNSKKEFIGDLMILRATRTIKVGEEILVISERSYDYNERTLALTHIWGITCTCELCSAEKADGSTLRKKRNERESEVSRFMASEKAVAAKRLSVLKAKRLAKSIEDTYDSERYEDLPRKALLGIQQWLTEATAR